MDRGLIACAEAISHEPQWEFHLYGQGEVASSLTARKYRNVFVHAPVPHDYLIKLASEATIYLAMYDPARAHNRFTASNKLFEAAQLGVPILTSKDTELGNEITYFNLGWSVSYNNISDIRSVLQEFVIKKTRMDETLRANLNSYYKSNLEIQSLEAIKVKSGIQHLVGGQSSKL